MSYVPNMPLAAYQPAPTRRDGYSEQDLLAMLPPRDMAHMQLSLGYLLGSLQHTRLGVYPDISAPRDSSGLLGSVISTLETVADEVAGRAHFADPLVAEPLAHSRRPWRESSPRSRTATRRAFRTRSCCRPGCPRASTSDARGRGAETDVAAASRVSAPFADRRSDRGGDDLCAGPSLPPLRHRRRHVERVRERDRARPRQGSSGSARPSVSTGSTATASWSTGTPHRTRGASPATT